MFYCSVLGSSISWFGNPWRTIFPNVSCFLNQKYVFASLSRNTFRLFKDERSLYEKHFSSFDVNDILRIRAHGLKVMKAVNSMVEAVSDENDESLIDQIHFVAHGHHLRGITARNEFEVRRKILNIDYHLLFHYLLKKGCLSQSWKILGHKSWWQFESSGWQSLEEVSQIIGWCCYGWAGHTRVISKNICNKILE